MKRSLCVFCLFALLLTACQSAAPGHSSTPEPTEPAEPTETGIVDGSPWFQTLRVVETMGETLVLARNGDEQGNIYTMSIDHCDFPVADGQLINVYFETIMETYPAQFGNVSQVELTEDPVDDRCGLYLQVLEDLWEVGIGSNHNISQLGIDLSGVSDLCGSEKSGVEYAFACKHDLFPTITGTWEELAEEGYIDKENLCWEEGVFFSITGSAEETFNGESWRSGLCAYYFCNCTAEKDDTGSWTYDIGAHAIS